jgi:hypothetical protein
MRGVRVGGWEDGYSNAVARLVEKLKAPCIGLAGPWGHAYPHNALPGPAIGFLQEALRFWDHWLKGRDTGLMAEPKLRVWMNSSHAPDPCAAERPGRWIAHRDWPAPAIQNRDFWLGARGLEPTRQPDAALSVKSPQNTGMMTVEWCSYGGSDGDFPGDQRIDDGNSLCFDTLPLGALLAFFGTPRLAPCVLGRPARWQRSACASTTSRPTAPPPASPTRCSGSTTPGTRPIQSRWYPASSYRAIIRSTPLRIRSLLGIACGSRSRRVLAAAVAGAICADRCGSYRR